MRKIMKRAFAVFIVVVMLLTSMPMSGFFNFNWEGLLGVKASAAEVKKSDLPEDFDLKVYMADVLFRTEGQGYCMTKIKKDDGSEVFCTAHQYDRFLSLISDFQSPATTVYNAFYEDKKFVNSAEAWEAIRKTANPSNAINDLNLQQQYESLIYAVLFDSLCDKKLQKASYSSAITNVTSFTDKLIDKPRTAAMFEKTSLDLDASDELKDTALAFLSNGRDDKWASILEYNGMVAKYSGIIDKILKSATDIYNYINKISMYRALADVGADAVRVLIDMKNATSDEILKSAFQAVIDSMSNDWFGIVDKVIFDVGFSVNMKAVKSLVDYGWKGCCEICPFLKGMAIGEAVGTAACNLLFATEDTIRQYEYMKMIVELENVSRPILKKYENAVKSNNNSSNAAAFWFTVDFISSLYATSANAANEMADICLNKGFVNYLIKICGGNNAERVEECKKTSSALLRNVIYNQKLIETVWENHIAEDYPQFFEKSNEESICSPSKTVKSISVSPKTVYCKAGECPSLPNITTDPADAECTYGFKSDNQDIFSDGTGFSSSQFLPAEKVGEANITVYSLEDPSVSDTFKLIVVSSDEELDKPENTDTESGTCGNGVSFVLYKDTGTLYISGNGSIYGGDFSGHEYYANAAWNENKEFIKKVIVAKGITDIGNYAFSNCAALRSVKLSNTVRRIYSYAFYNCKDLTSITIPNSVPNIGNSAFCACTGLTSAIIGDGVTSIGDDAFYGCTGLTSITIPDSVTSIGEDAFGYCSGVASITVNNNNKVYDSRNNCNAIIERNTLIVGCKNTVIPNGIEYIGKHAFYGCTGLTSIKIPDSVTYIGESAFLRCKGLVSVIIGNGVTTLSGFDFEDNKNLVNVVIGNSVKRIGWREFSGCTGLTSIVIPDSVTSIDDVAFGGCTGLTSIKIPDSVTSIGDRAFYGCTGLTKVNITDISAWCNISFSNIYSNPLLYSRNLYINDKIINDLIIPDGVTNIGDYAFYNCSGLTSIKIPDSVTSIGERAFNNCISLTSIIVNSNNKVYDSRDNCNAIINTKTNALLVGCKNTTILDNITSIGNSAFYGCSGLTSITIPDSVTYIGESAFYGCTGLTKVNITDISAWCNISFSNIYSNPLLYSHNLYINDKIINDLIIPDGVTNIGDYAFYNCSGLTSIKIPDSVTGIGDRAFYGCTGLASAIIGDGVTTLSGFDFNGNKNLKSIIIGNSVTNIGDYAFDGCIGLTSIKIPDSVTSIGDRAFDGCTGLTSAIIGDGVTSIGYYAFDGCTGLTSATIGNGVTSIGARAFNNCSSLVSIIIPDSVTSIGDCAFDGCTGLTSATIGNGVTSIGAYAFNNCSSLASIIIPDSVTGIGDSAFDGCTGLTSATIGNGVTSIGKCVFYDCSSLTSVTIGYSVTSIGDSAFENCSALTSLIMPESVLNIGCSAFEGCENLKSVVIPTNVESIEIYSFSHCYNLTSITIPDNVSNIGSSAFEGCYNLKHVFYKGSQHDWNNTVIDENGNYYLINCYVHYNVLTDETINHLKEEITEATCTSSGKIKITCECGYSYIEVIEKLGHTGALVRTIAPTCYAGGYSIYHCDRCDEDYNDDYVDELGHNFVNDVCTRCGSVVNELNLGEYKTVMVNGSENVYFKFIPRTSGTYYFYSDSSYDTLGYVYDSNFKQLSSNDDGGNDCNFCISCTLEADTVYYLCAGILFIDSSQKIAVCVANSFEAETAHDLQTIVHEACCVEDGEIITKCKNCDLTNVTVTAKSSGHNYIDGVCTLCGWIEGLEYELNDSEEIIITGYSGNVTELKIPSNLSRFPVVGIGENAFSFSCNLTHIFIPSSIKFIADYAFIGCENLLKITVDAENQFYCSDDKGVLFNKDKTALIQYPIRSEQTLYSIPNGVLNICSGAFYNCNRLVSISLPSSIERVNKDVFAGCYNLVEVFYSESQNEWSKIAFDEDVSLFLNDRFIHYNVSADEISTHLKKETVSEATCTSFGEVKIVCDCGYSYEIVIPEFGHQKGRLKDIIAPTCTECGYSIYSCIRCNEDYKSDYTEMLGHQGEFVKIVAATCVDDGYTVYHCIRCGEDYKDDFVGTTGHKFENDLCTECGYRILNINLGETKTVTLKSSEKSYYKFIPEESGTYYFYSNVSRDCYGYVYDSNMNQLISDDDGGYNANFKISYDFEAGQVYYLAARFYSSDEVGDIVVSISDRFNDLTKKPGTTIEIHDEDKIIYGLEAGITSDDLLKCFSVSDNCYIDANNEKLGTGTILSLYSNETGEVIDKYTIILFGDVNGDGWYDGMDAITVSCIANGMLTREQVGEAVWMAADCNHDGKIDQADVDLLNQAGLLLSSVDQTKSTEELLETSSEYNEYLNLIDQSVEVKDDEPEQESPETQKPSLLEFLLTTIWNYIKLILSLIK